MPNRDLSGKLYFHIEALYLIHKYKKNTIKVINWGKT